MGQHLQVAYDFIADYGEAEARKLLHSRGRYSKREERCTGCELVIPFSELYYVRWNILGFPYCEACRDAIATALSEMQGADKADDRRLE